jgi:hypothetical protein
MANLVLTISLTEDGVPLPNFPIIRRLNPSQATPLDGVPVAADNNTSTFVAIPGTGTLTNQLQCLVLTPDQLVNLEFNAGSYLPLAAGAVLVVFGVDVTGTIATLATVNNPAASVASNLYGVVAGV